MADEQPTEPQTILQQLSGDLMSPYCPGRTIASCPSKSARRLEDEILALAEQGKTREEIEGALVERFGEDIIGYRPPPFLVGGVFVLGLLALVGLFTLGRRWARKARAASSSEASQGQGAVPPPTREELDALDDALDEEEVL